MSNENKIECPNCGHEIDVQDVLQHQVEDKIRREYQRKLVDEKNKIEFKEKKLAEEKLAFEEKKRKENEMFQERLDAKIKEESTAIEIRLKTRLEKEQEDRILNLNKELNEKSDKIKELNATKVEVEKLKREKEELKGVLELEAEKELNRRLRDQTEKIQKTEKEKSELVIRELEKKIEDTKKISEELKHKYEQGSMKLQGEVQELAIEEWLRSNFPIDTIEEIKSGARGADCIQIVNTNMQTNCGSIYYESKRTENFQPAWIEKFKKDMREKGADIGVIVTQAMPKDMDRFGQKEGIWICTYEEFKGLSAALRETLVQVSNVASSQENKGDKMQLLYDFLTSNAFKMHMDAIVEGFMQMKSDIDKEKNAFQRIWKQREAQIDKVLLNSSQMYGSIKGIAGNAIQSIQALELPGDDLELEDEF